MSVPSQGLTFRPVITPQASKTVPATWTTAAIDTVGFNWAAFYFLFGVTDIGMTVFKLQESNTTSGYADVPNGNFATAIRINGEAANLPTAADDGDIFTIFCDLRSRKRYLKPVCTCGDGVVGVYLTAWCLLGRANIATGQSAGMGFNQAIKC